MAGIHKERFTREETREYVIFHLEAIKKTIPETTSPEKHQKLQEIIEEAQLCIREYVLDKKEVKESRYEKEIEAYMACLFQKDSRKAVGLIRRYMDAEHYCTSVTQMAMAQMYDKIFDGERKNKTVLSVCPGMELHEMGARIVADLFENHGGACEAF